METLKNYLNKPDFGLFLLRLIVGGMMVAHGVSHFMSGNFERLGSSMQFVGIEFGFVFWGFMAALIQTVGGFFVVIGFLFRLSCFLLLTTLIVAMLYHINAGDDLLKVTGHAIKTAAVFAALLFTGPGAWAARS